MKDNVLYQLLERFPERLPAVCVLVGALIAAPAMNADAAVINFDDLSNGTVVTNQYAGVTFASTPGSVNYITAQDFYNSTKPNFICSGGANSSINCTDETIVSFASGASGITFDAMGVNDVGLVALVDVFVGGAFSFTYNVIGNAELFNPLRVDLSGTSNVTSLRLHGIVDAGGIGWDTFTFELAPAPVSEPGALALLAFGLAGTSFMRRRRLS